MQFIRHCLLAEVKGTILFTTATTALLVVVTKIDSSHYSLCCICVSSLFKIMLLIWKVVWEEILTHFLTPNDGLLPLVGAHFCLTPDELLCLTKPGQG